ncbi:MAG: C40 family peptidase [Deltaproteobacteria bacterium]|nr:C40 family peptidase [Deltaproteobacteria bacterium]
MLGGHCKENIKNFAKKALGVPFADRGRDLAGWDCWGMLLAAYQECFGIALPEGLEYSRQNSAEAAAALKEGAQTWREIPAGQEHPGDVLFARPCHVGLVLAPGRMLNCREGAGTIIERYDHAVWRRSIIGIYRHARLADL